MPIEVVPSVMKKSPKSSEAMDKILLSAVSCLKNTD